MDEREMQELLQRAMEEIRTLGAVSDKTAQELREAAEAGNVFKKQIKDAGKQFSKDMLGLTKSIANGNMEFTQFSSVIDTVTGAVSKMAASLPLLGAAMVAVAEGSKFLLDQIQQTTKAFNDAGQAGLLGAQGMTGLRDQFTDAGLTLEIFTRTIAKNSEALANFGGTAFDGAKRFGTVVGIMRRDFGPQLLQLGVGFDAQAEQSAAYAALLARSGLQQRMTDDQLAKGTARYITELDAMAKLTGMQKDKIIEQQNAMMGDARFRAKYEEMVAQGREKEAKAMMDFFTMVGKHSPELARGLSHAATGFYTSTEAIQTLVTVQGGAADILERLGNGAMTAEQALAEFRGRTRESVPMVQEYAKAVGDTGVFINFGQLMDFSAAKTAEFGRVIGTQAQQLGGADGLTQSVATAQTAMMNFANAVQNMATIALPKASLVVAEFAKVMDKGLGAFATASGLEKPKIDLRALDQLPKKAKGGITDGASIAGEAGPEAVVPLPDGKTIPVQLDIKKLVGPKSEEESFESYASRLNEAMMKFGTGPTVGGYNEYLGYNQGAMGTDVNVLKTIAEKLGAYDREANAITDPATWKQIMQSGVATTMDLGSAKVGLGESTEVTNMVSDRIAELTGGGTDIAEAIRQAMAESMENMVATLRTDGGSQQVLVSELQRLGDLMARQNNTSEKILQVTNN
jgi:hypothetical protein